MRLLICLLVLFLVLSVGTPAELEISNTGAIYKDDSVYWETSNGRVNITPSVTLSGERVIVNMTGIKYSDLIDVGVWFEENAGYAHIQTISSVEESYFDCETTEVYYIINGSTQGRTECERKTRTIKGWADLPTNIKFINGKIYKYATVKVGTPISIVPFTLYTNSTVKYSVTVKDNDDAWNDDKDIEVDPEVVSSVNELSIYPFDSDTQDKQDFRHLLNDGITFTSDTVKGETVNVGVFDDDNGKNTTGGSAFDFTNGGSISTYIWIDDFGSGGTFSTGAASTASWYMATNGADLVFAIDGTTVGTFTPLLPQVWYHLTLVVNQSSNPGALEWYVNGILNATNSPSVKALPDSGANTFYIGRLEPSGIETEMRLTCTRIFNASLTPSQVTEIYDADVSDCLSLSNIETLNYPQFVNNYSYPSTIQKDTVLYTNLNITSENGVHSVVLETNASVEPFNVTSDSCNGQNDCNITLNFTVNISTGDIYLKFYANDTFNNWNESEKQTRTVTAIETFLTCEYNDNPSFDDEMEWVCSFNFGGEKIVKSFQCYTYVQKLGQTIQVNPPPGLIESYGVTPAFEADNGIVRAYFDKKNVRVDQKFNFSIICSNSTYVLTETVEVMPTHLELFNIGDRVIWAKTNAGLLAFIGFALVLLFIAWSIWKKSFLQ